ncbi:MAG: hypothetical protein EXR72_10655 [Myxococcales bacterium]|nr:hypothetical protein [Myxococcales bacterium]
MNESEGGGPPPAGAPPGGSGDRGGDGGGDAGSPPGGPGDGARRRRRRGRGRGERPAGSTLQGDAAQEGGEGDPQPGPRPDETRPPRAAQGPGGPGAGRENPRGPNPRGQRPEHPRGDRPEGSRGSRPPGAPRAPEGQRRGDRRGPPPQQAREDRPEGARRGDGGPPRDRDRRPPGEPSRGDRGRPDAGRPSTPRPQPIAQSGSPATVAGRSELVPVPGEVARAVSPRATTAPPAADFDSGWDLPEGGPAPVDPPAAGGDDEAGPTRFVEEPLSPRDPDGEDVFIDLTDRPRTRGALANVAGIKFREAGSIHEYDAGDQSYQRGEQVVVESERGPILGIVAVGSRRTLVSEPLHRIVRRAGAEEERQRERNARKEQEAFVLCRDKIRERRMPMKLLRAELPLQGAKLLFYFASEERIDFRDLVKDLGARLRGRIEMRQVGARDEAKMVGGLGDCGRELCCSTFLPSFAPVSIKMAKDQGLVLNPARVTGQCGRLKCCLVYEHALYQEMRKGLPKVGKRVKTPAGEGRVVELDVLRQMVRVGFMEGGTQTFPAATVEALAPPQQGGRPAPEPAPE